MDHIFKAEAPWVEVICDTTESFSGKLVQECPSSFKFVGLSGGNCETKEGLFSNFGRALKFPDYFGKNWNAFEECIRDLEWLPATGYVIEIYHAQRLLIFSESDYRIFVDIMEKAGRDWATPRLGDWPRPATPFHVLLMVNAVNCSGVRNWLVPVSSYL